MCLSPANPFDPGSSSDPWMWAECVCGQQYDMLGCWHRIPMDTAVTTAKSCVKSKQGGHFSTDVVSQQPPEDRVPFQRYSLRRRGRAGRRRTRSTLGSLAQITSRRHPSRPVPVPTRAIDRDEPQTGHQRLRFNRTAIRSLSSLISPHTLSLWESQRCCQLSVTPPPRLQRERDPLTDWQGAFRFARSGRLRMLASWKEQQSPSSHSGGKKNIK